MNLYAEIVPSREICEELAKAGICKENPELWYQYEDKVWVVVDYSWLDETYRKVIAPTLLRLIDELGEYCSICRDGDIEWQVWMREPDEIWVCISTDKHLPNAVAKALLAIKKG